jgi:hypothetical protein
MCDSAAVDPFTPVLGNSKHDRNLALMLCCPQIGDLSGELEALKKQVHDLSTENTRLQAAVESTRSYKVPRLLCCLSTFAANPVHYWLNVC